MASVSEISSIPIVTTALDIHIFRARPSHVGTMSDIFVNSFDLDGSVKLMYTKDEIWCVIRDILRTHMNVCQIEFRVAQARDTGTLLGWMSFGTIATQGPVPPLAPKEMTSWVAQRLLRGKLDDLRYRLAFELESRSLEGQAQHTPGNRLVINTIVTEPEYRHRGVASKLLQSAVGPAKSADWPIWVQTPDVYERLFWDHGFRGVGIFSLDLNDYEPPEEEAMGSTRAQRGIQTWRHMKLGTRAESLLQKDEDETPKARSTYEHEPNLVDIMAESNRSSTNIPKGFTAVN